MAKLKDLERRLEEAERRLKDLEARPLQVIGVPYVIPHYVWPSIPNPYPQYVPPPFTFTPQFLPSVTSGLTYAVS